VHIAVYVLLVEIEQTRGKKGKKEETYNEKKDCSL